MARTIDDLGPESSIDYAKAQQRLDQTFIKDASVVSKQTEIDSTISVYSSEVDKLFPKQVHGVSFADFPPPSKFNEQSKRLFTFLVIPSIGDEDKKQMYRQRIESSKELTEQLSYEFPWQKTQEIEDWDKESHTLLSLLDKISSLDRDLEEINNQRSGLKKG